MAPVHKAIAEEVIISKIYFVRGQKIMLEKDLAEMYGVTTGNFNKAVKRNLKRFPRDFMFQLTTTEYKNLIFQIGISSWGGTRHLPMAFTEQGVAMLSSVLNSTTAVEVNIRIIRVFTKMREMILSHKEILLKMEKLSKKMVKQSGKIKKHEKEIQQIFNALKQLLDTVPERPKIGFKRRNEVE